jgi:hypothetical protein
MEALLINGPSSSGMARVVPRSCGAIEQFPRVVSLFEKPGNSQEQCFLLSRNSSDSGRLFKIAFHHFLGEMK